MILKLIRYLIQYCHIRPDWVLIYEIRETELVLLLVETGSHADLDL